VGQWFLRSPGDTIPGVRGWFRAALRQSGYNDIESWDKRARNAKTQHGYRYGYFDYRNAPPSSSAFRIGDVYPIGSAFDGDCDIGVGQALAGLDDHRQR
jgi:hypothetical protein